MLFLVEQPADVTVSRPNRPVRCSARGRSTWISPLPSPVAKFQCSRRLGGLSSPFGTANDAIRCPGKKRTERTQKRDLKRTKRKRTSRGSPSSLFDGHDRADPRSAKNVTSTNVRSLNFLRLFLCRIDSRAAVSLGRSKIWVIWPVTSKTSYSSHGKTTRVSNPNRHVSAVTNDPWESARRSTFRGRSRGTEAKCVRLQVFKGKGRTWCAFVELQHFLRGKQHTILAQNPGELNGATNSICPHDSLNTAPNECNN